jgi:hypothetical protein
MSITALLVILLLCCSGVSTAAIGIQEINSFTNMSQMQLICCIMVILLVGGGGMFAVVRSPI